MAKRNRRNEKVRCKFFTWFLTVRGNVFQADGRANRPSAGRHSLEARTKEQALQNLERLDRVQAVRFGMADKSVLTDLEPDLLPIEIGVQRFLDYCRRPAVVGGPKPVTPKRYGAVLGKAIAHFRDIGLTCWNQVKPCHLESYAAWLDGEGYTYATEFLEITVLKQTLNFFIREGLLPQTNKIVMPMKKPSGTDTYCYTSHEVRTMISHCQKDVRLLWLAEVILGLATTGMRISELSNLNWVNVDLDRNVIVLKDERRNRISLQRKPRTTKSSRDRMFPIHASLNYLLSRKAKDEKAGNVFLAAKGGKLRANNVRESLIKHVIGPLSALFPSPSDEIGFKNGRLHSLRHFFTSECASCGVPEQIVMNWLGHQHSSMVRRYFHLHNSEAQKQIRKLNFLESAVVT